MKRTTTQSLSDLLKLCIEDLQVENRLKETDVIQSWEEVLGKMVAKYTDEINIHQGTLYVKISSPVVKNELFMMRNQICQRLNEQVNAQVVNRIIFK